MEASEAEHLGTLILVPLGKEFGVPPWRCSNVSGELHGFGS